MSKCLKVNFCAAPSSYKSTVCVGVESLLKQDSIITDTSKEYVREYINSFGVPRQLFEQMIITDFQDSRDVGVAAVSQIMLSDNPAVNSYIYSARMLQDIMKSEKRTIKTPAEYFFLEVMHTKTLKKLEWYDVLIVFPPTDDIIRDGTRTETMEEKLNIYNAIAGFLHAQNVPYYLVDGTSQERIEKCYDIVKTEYSRR